MDIFESDNYKTIFMNAIRTGPKNGRGALRGMSIKLNIHSSRISQVLQGKSHFTLEHALQVSQYLGFGERECDYILLLVERDRAGSPELRKFCEKRIAKTRKENNRIASVVPQTDSEKLNPEDENIFYSSWIYSAISLLCDISEYRQIDSIATRLHLPRETVQKALDFLCKANLVKRNGNQYAMGTACTHLDSRSPLIINHHTNWRIRAIQTFPRLRDEELAYSGPIVLSRTDFMKVRRILLKVIQQITHMAVPSQSERLACLAIDWFEI